MSHRFGFALAIAAIAAVPSNAQESCEKLKGLTLPGVTITLAASVPAGQFTLPSGPTRNAPPKVPAFCRVAGVVTPEVKFELWMPVAWNKKLLGIGQGGFAGAIAYDAMVGPLQDGYATSSTDTGHSADRDDMSWALGHLERVVDFAHRGVHVMTEADKAIIQAFYGAKPAHSYFNGCSGGGGEAMMEAQRYPRDYDGIIAGAPSSNWTRHYVGGHVWIARAMEGDGYLPANKIPVIADAVNAACDALDGVKDGVLNDPRRCHFDPTTLLCKNGDGPNCLTGAQVESVQKIYTGLRNSDGDQLYPGLMPGGEGGPGGWANWMSGKGPGTGGHSGRKMPFFQFIVFEDPNWDFRTFKFDAPPGFDSDVDFTDAKVGSIFNAMDPNLSAFRGNGGKMIQYHGWSDPDITPMNSINYYDSVVKFVGHDGNHGLAETREFYRLFMVPGMQHCTGGPGPNTFNMVGALEQWVEKGAAPEKVIASHATNGKVDRTRPLCPYPQEARWKGTGSTDDAANFVCALPPRP